MSCEYIHTLFLKKLSLSLSLSLSHTHTHTGQTDAEKENPQQDDTAMSKEVWLAGRHTFSKVLSVACVHAFMDACMYLWMHVCTPAGTPSQKYFQ